jgi:NADH-quinone oxidoreductase subunit L
MNPNVLLAIPLLPLAAAIIAGLFGRLIGRTAAHVVTIAAVGIAFLLSAQITWQLISGEVGVYNESVYTWLVSDGVRMEVGFLVDHLSVLMMCVVTFVSFCVHVYTIGYMQDDPGYQRFFAYISLFTFAMLMLVMSNNFMQLIFGWEAEGVVSYLLIGFWYTKPSAIFANLKAFLVNRVGDFGFVLGIAGVVYFTGSLDYRDAFAAAPQIAQSGFALTNDFTVSAMTLICICLFIGAMGKSAQVPLHVWLPDSMEGPTPISALIHAATMVTAGIFMVARFSPLFEQSETALSFVLVVGQQRHQARRRVLDPVAAGLHDGGARRFGLRRCNFPFDDARVLQGLAVPRRRFGDHRHASRAGHAQDGRACQSHAHHGGDLLDRCPRADRHAVPVRFLFKRFHHRSRARGRPLGCNLCVLVRAARRVRDGALHLPHDIHDLPRRAALGGWGRARARRCAS